MQLKGQLFSSRNGVASPSPRCSSLHPHLRRHLGLSTGQQLQQQHPAALQPPRRTLCRATLDDPELAELVNMMHEQRAPLPEQRECLERCLRLIDEANSADPSKVSLAPGAPKLPRRVAYANELTRWVKHLEPEATDELLILARGKDVQSWELTKIKRDDYSPSWAGMRQWEQDRKAWQAERLTAIMKEAGYDEATIKSVSDVMSSKDVPDPRHMRKHDLLGPFGLVNFRLLRMAEIQQTLKDAEALLFLEMNFAAMQDSGADPKEMKEMLSRELSRVSQRCFIEALAMKWNDVQRKMLMGAFRSPSGYRDIMKTMENSASAGNHPGDWRFKDFDYE